MSRRARVLLVSACLLGLALAFLPSVVKKMPDFEVYWRAGGRVLQREPLYRPEDGHYQLKYLPSFALICAPLSLLPLRASKTVWFLFSIAVIAGLVSMSARTLPRRRLAVATLVCLTILAMLKFYAHELSLGQANALMALIVVVGFSRLAAGRDGPGGWWLAAAAVVKPYAAAFLPYLVIRGRFKAAASCLTGLAIGLVAPVAVYGAAGTASLLSGWAATVSQSTLPNLTGQDNVSIWAMFAKWFGAGSFSFACAVMTVALLGVVALVVVWKGRTQPNAEYLDMCLVLMLLPLVSPQGWDYVLLVATPAVMVIVNALDELPSGVGWVTGAALVTMAFSVFDFMGRRAYATFMSLSVITVCALVLVGLLAYLRIRKLA